jgi:hypothetical protein
MVFAREIEGQTLTFGVSGKLIMNAVVMYDHQTGTLWSQFLGSGVDGPLTGVDMQLLPSQLTSWAAWVEQHPDTKLLDRTIGRGSGRDPYTSYYSSTSAGVLGEENEDERLRRKDLVIGLDHGRDRIAYALKDLADVLLVNDTYESAPIVVTHDPNGGAAAAFSRVVSDRTLTFEAVDRLAMRDAETGTTWASLTGKAIDGELSGETLEQLPSFVSSGSRGPISILPLHCGNPNGRRQRSIYQM